MTELQRQIIADCGRACERELILADVYDKAGMLLDAAICFEFAESESELAFHLAASA